MMVLIDQRYKYARRDNDDDLNRMTNADGPRFVTRNGFGLPSTDRPSSR